MKILHLFRKFLLILTIVLYTSNTYPMTSWFSVSSEDIEWIKGET